MENNPLLDISQISGKRGNKRLEEMQWIVYGKRSYNFTD